MSQIYSVLGRFRWGFLRLGRIGIFFFFFGSCRMSDDFVIFRPFWAEFSQSLFQNISDCWWCRDYIALVISARFSGCFGFPLEIRSYIPFLAGVSSYEEIYSFLICILRFEIHRLRISVLPRFDWIESNFEWTWSTATITGSVSTAKSGMRLECVN